MGIDLATILSVYGGVFNGAVVGWSIGGKEFTGIRYAAVHERSELQNADIQQWLAQQL